jgi:hypothetical protein
VFGFATRTYELVYELVFYPLRFFFTRFFRTVSCHRAGDRAEVLIPQSHVSPDLVGVNARTNTSAGSLQRKLGAVVFVVVGLVGANMLRQGCKVANFSQLKIAKLPHQENTQALQVRVAIGALA